DRGGRRTGALRAYLDRGHDIFERLLENRDRVLLGLSLDQVESAVDDVLRHRLLAGAHDHVHEFRDHQVPIFRVRVDLSFLGTMTAGHRAGPSLFHLAGVSGSSRGVPGFAWLHLARPGIYAKRPNHLGRFAPYLERLCLRFFTPCVSSTPRRMW